MRALVRWLVRGLRELAFRLHLRRRPKLQHYDPRNVKITFNGVYLDGYFDGSFIDIERSDGHRRDPRLGPLTITLVGKSKRPLT